MLTFQKVENALKRAKELQDIGNDITALQVLYATIMHSRFRAQGWDSVKEQVMMRFVQFCVDMEKLKFVRDGLYQYRTISHHNNIASLGKVITELRDKAEARLKEAKQSMGDDAAIDGVESDLEETKEESPEALMLSTLQVEVRHHENKAVLSSLRFVWETYKMIMDILKFSPKLEKIYHETARRACYFCRENERTMEFKRLCDSLRQNYSLLLKYKSKQESESLLRPELHLETRIAQLNVAAELGLWRESANTAEDICNLGIHELFLKTFRSKIEPFHKSREKLLKWLAVYYEKLSMIFWVSENYLFHGLAWVKFILHVRNFKKNVADEELQRLCCTAVLAVLAIPTPQQEKKADDFGSEMETVLENHKKMTALLGHPTVPSRDMLKYVLVHKDILSKSSETCQKLYSLLETDFSPLNLCAQCQPLLAELGEGLNAQYVAPLKRVIFHNLIVQLSKAFTSVTIDYFTTHICPKEFYDWEDTEKVLVSLVHHGHVRLRLDYAKKAIYFGVATIDPMITMRHELVHLAKSLDKVVGMIYPGMLPEERLEKKRFYDSINTKLRDEHERILLRNQENDTKRLEKQEEQVKVEEQRKAAELQRKRIEEQKEFLRREEALKQREERRVREETYKAKSETAQHLLDEIRKIRGSIVIRGKPLEEISIMDVLEGNVELDDIERLQEEQIYKERRENLRQRRLEAKRMDHFIRAARQEELPLLVAWKTAVSDNDTKALLKLQSKYEKEHKQAYNKALEEKQVFEVVLEEKKKWVETKMSARVIEYEEESKKQQQRIKKALWDLKVSRARERKLIHLSRKRAEEAAREREEEAQKRAGAEAELHDKSEGQKLVDKYGSKQKPKPRELGVEVKREFEGSPAPQAARGPRESLTLDKDDMDMAAWRLSAAPADTAGSTQRATDASANTANNGGSATPASTAKSNVFRPKVLRAHQNAEEAERSRNVGADSMERGSWRQGVPPNGSIASDERRNLGSRVTRPGKGGPFHNTQMNGSISRG